MRGCGRREFKDEAGERGGLCESVRWIEGCERVAEQARQMPLTRLVYVADREGDIREAAARDHAVPGGVVAHRVVRLVAMLGGLIGRKGDGEPGVKTLWQGLQRLHQAVETAQILGEAAQTG